MLIGAGFSAPKGYPIGSYLNNAIAKCTGEEFAFSSGGSMVISTDGKKPNLGYPTSYDLEFNFLKDLIQLYIKNVGQFDYEEFYDFLKEKASIDKDVIALVQSQLSDYYSIEQVLAPLDNIYSQVVSYYLKDYDGNSWHDNSGHACGPIYPGYTGILNCIKHLRQDYIININTLNHDLFLESLNASDWLQGELCDGFEELGSPYYGELNINHRYYKVRLSCYTGNYDKPIRLSKLHGSRDYVVYYTMSNTGVAHPESYIKIRHGIGFADIYKEKNENGDLTYENCFINYHADFLTGTTSKIERYKEPLLYQKLFEIFRANLKEASKLIIAGYGAKDSEINKMIVENFDYKTKPVFIIDPFPAVGLRTLQSMLNATLIEKHLDDVGISDIE